MKRSTFLTITALIYIPSGIAMILMPHTIFGLLGFDLGVDGAILGKVTGAAILGMGLMNFYSRNSSFTPSLKGIIIGNMVYHILDVIFIATAVYGELLNEVSRGMIVFHGVLAFGFAYYILKKPAPLSAGT